MIGMVRAMLRKRNDEDIPIVVTDDDTDIDEAIGVAFSTPNKPFYTKCRIDAYFGSHRAHLEKGFHWNGADIPRLAWTLLGISPLDVRSIIASGFHDEGCQNKRTRQIIADATFAELLKPFRLNGHYQAGVGRTRALLMYMAVRFYSMVGRPLLKTVKRKCTT